MKKSGLLESTRRGYFRITDRGMNVLNKGLARIDVNFLEQFEEFRQFRALKHTKEGEGEIDEGDPEKTPEEALESAYRQLRDNLANDLLQQVKSCSPGLFEKIVVELLVKMGYGGSRQDAGRAIWKNQGRRN